MDLMSVSPCPWRKILDGTFIWAVCSKASSAVISARKRRTAQRRTGKQRQQGRCYGYSTRASERWNEAYDSEKKTGGWTTTVDGRRRERLKKKMRRGKWEIPVQSYNDTIVGAHFGRAGQRPKMDPRSVTRLVERTAVGEGERGWVSKGWTKVSPLTWGGWQLTRLARGGGWGWRGLLYRPKRQARRFTRITGGLGNREGGVG